MTTKTIEMWSNITNKWIHHSTVNEKDAKETLASLQYTLSTMRYRIKEESTVTLKRWNSFTGKWETHSTYVDQEHAEQNLAFFQGGEPRARFRID